MKKLLLILLLLIGFTNVSYAISDIELCARNHGMGSEWQEKEEKKRNLICNTYGMPTYIKNSENDKNFKIPKYAEVVTGSYSYGRKWKCKSGYKVADNSYCIPDMARVSNNVLGWECYSNYRIEGSFGNETCKKQKSIVPPNASRDIKDLNDLAKDAVKEAERLAEEKAREAEILAQEVAKQVKKEEEKRKLAEEMALIAEKKKDEAKRLAEEERIKLDELEEELAAQQLAFENEQYNRLLTEEVQAEQDQERLFKIEDQLNTLKSAYVNNIAARVKSFWRYQGVEDDWTAEVYVVQDRDGTVLAVDVRNANVDNSNKAEVFKDSIRRAVYKASPLPVAPNEAVFDQELILIFRVN